MSQGLKRLVYAVSIKLGAYCVDYSELDPEGGIHLRPSPSPLKIEVELEEIKYKPKRVVLPL